MPLVIPVGYAQVVHSITLNGDAEPMAITYGISLTVTPPADPAGLAEDLHVAYITAMLNILATGYQIVATEIRYTVAEELIPRVARFDQITFGTGSSNLVPQNTAYLIHKDTAFSGRRHKGRIYHPGVGEPDVGITGVLTVTERNRISTALASWLTGVNNVAGVGGMEILHSTGLSVTPIPTPVTALRVDPVVATQRRRPRS